MPVLKVLLFNGRTLLNKQKKINTMSTQQLKTTKNNNAFSKYTLMVLFTLTSILTGYYLITRAFPFLIISEENYGPYFFRRAYWVFAHVIFGILATLIGPFQFIPQFRNKYLAVHRKLGQVYIFATVLGGLSSMYLATTSTVNLTYSSGLFTLGFFWVAAALMALVAIKNGKVELHKEWMIRSYILTSGFVIARLFVDVLVSLEIASRIEALTLMNWAGWVIPLFLAELIIQGRKI